MNLPEGAVALTPEEEAEVQAAKDRLLLEELKALRERDGYVPPDEQEAITVTTDRVPMNRAARRQQVALYARILAETERQTPIVNPTIIPKSKRRRKGRGNRRLNRA